MAVNVRRRETPHHTHEQIAGYLRDAVELVEQADVPIVLRAIAYGKAVELLAAKHIVMEQSHLGILEGVRPGQ